MSLLLANLLIRSTPCFVTIRSNGILLEWIWRGSFLRWDLLAPVGMQIILVERNTLEMVPYHQSPTALHCEKSRSANVFKRMRDKAAYDEKYVIMRKEWRASE